MEKLNGIAPINRKTPERLRLTASGSDLFDGFLRQNIQAQ
jgi:hypothetical protein